MDPNAPSANRDIQQCTTHFKSPPALQKSVKSYQNTRTNGAADALRFPTFCSCLKAAQARRRCACRVAVMKHAPEAQSTARRAGGCPRAHIHVYNRSMRAVTAFKYIRSRGHIVLRKRNRAALRSCALWALGSLIHEASRLLPIARVLTMLTMITPLHSV